MCVWQSSQRTCIHAYMHTWLSHTSIQTCVHRRVPSASANLQPIKPMYTFPLFLLNIRLIRHPFYCTSSHLLQ